MYIILLKTKNEINKIKSLSSKKWWHLGGIGIIISGYSLISFIPLLLSVENTSISVPFRALSLLYILVIGYYYLTKRKIKINIFGYLYLLFWLMYSIRIFNETLFNSETLGRSVSEYYLFAFFVTFIPSIVYYVKLNKEEILIAGKILWIICIIAAIGIIISYIIGATIENGASETARFSIDTLNPISMGHLGLTLLIMSVFVYSKLSGKLKFLALFTAILGFILMSVAASRSALIAAIIIFGIFYLILFFRRMKRNPLIAMIIPLILITIIMLAPFIFKYIEDTYGFTVLSGLEVIGSDDDQSGNIRKLLFQSAWEQFTNSPVIGDGLEEKSMRFYPHNNIIEAFMATGLLGGSIILTLYFLSIINSLKLIISNSEYTWVGLILLQYIVFTQFSGALWQSGALFSLMAIASVSIKILKD